MKTTFVCLANSYKEGGRCIAGIEIQNGTPSTVNNKPKWIRPVCKTEHGKVPENLVSHIKILDIVELNTTENTPDGFQSENILFDTNSIKVIGKFPLANIPMLCDSSVNVIFGNKGKAISEDCIGSLTYSLMMISTNDFESYEKIYEDNESKPQARLKFKYNFNEYDLPITDPIFLNLYKTNKNILIDKTVLYIVLSVGVIHKSWYYKLVAGII